MGEYELDDDMGDDAGDLLQLSEDELSAEIAEAFTKGRERGRADARAEFLSHARFYSALNGDGAKFVKAVEALTGPPVVKAVDPPDVSPVPGDDDRDADPDPDDTDLHTPAPGSDELAHELLLHAVEYARDCEHDGTDAQPVLDALHELAHDPHQLHAVLEGAHAKAFAPEDADSLFVPWVVFKAWTEAQKQLHPRDDVGRFVSVEAMHAAKHDPKLAKELRKRVTDPEERKKLENALSGAADIGHTKRSQARADAHAKRAKKTADRDQARAIRDRLFAQYQQGMPLHGDDLRALIPHLATMSHAELTNVRVFLHGAGAGFGGERKLAERRDRLISWAQGKAEPITPADPLEGATIHSTERLPLPGPQQNPVPDPADSTGAEEHAARMRQWELDRPGNRAAQEARDRADQRPGQGPAPDAMGNRKQYEAGLRAANPDLAPKAEPPAAPAQPPAEPHPASVPVEYPHVPGSDSISGSVRDQLRRGALAKKLATAGALLPDEARDFLESPSYSPGLPLTAARAETALTNKLGVTQEEAKRIIASLTPSGTATVAGNRKRPTYDPLDLFRATGKLFENSGNETPAPAKTGVEANQSDSPATGSDNGRDQGVLSEVPRGAGHGRGAAVGAGDGRGAGGLGDGAGRFVGRAPERAGGSAVTHGGRGERTVQANGPAGGRGAESPVDSRGGATPALQPPVAGVDGGVPANRLPVGGNGAELAQPPAEPAPEPKPARKPRGAKKTGEGIPDTHEQAFPGSKGHRSRKDAESSAADVGEHASVAKVGGRWQVVVPKPGGAAPAAPAAITDDQFAKEVQAAADHPEASTFGGNKTFIHDVFARVKQAHPDLTREEFDQRLLAANQTDRLTLSRADLVQLMHHEDVHASEVTHPSGAATFHFVLRSHDGGKPARGPAPPEEQAPAWNAAIQRDRDRAAAEVAAARSRFQKPPASAPVPDHEHLAQMAASESDPVARDYLEAAAANAQGSVAALPAVFQRRRAIDQLSSLLRQSHQNRHPTATAALRRAIESLGGTVFGTPGERVAFDPLAHESASPVSTGDPVEIVSPGVSHPESHFEVADAHRAAGTPIARFAHDETRARYAGKAVVAPAH